MDSPELFQQDLRRTVVLGAYLRHWGMPRDRQRFSRQTDVIEVYFFPATAESPVARFATVGASSFAREGGARSEFLLVLPADLGGATFEEVAGFLMDFVVHSRRDDVKVEPGRAIPPSERVPKAWPTRALLVDEAVGEDEEFGGLHLGPQHIELCWLVPLHEAEYAFIQKEGFDAFSELLDASDLSPADVRRPSLV
ncbi:suppressor of fused domain protein [Myxococcus sp. K38C18041901]|uniref:suppressor of fused domain protein n=1 Tax=Myxococcus guangdongensis TaxID=2906760 RepID=UPI0020A6FEFD|nr:suppressor of fused domain protein [Myxococcus guangdongensis]MCP3064168.1 suppressor of fused domain protein [Myxococcus guangdongensis]